MRQKVILICEECLSRNYQTYKKDDDVRLTIKKFCTKCNRHTLHRQTK